MTLIGNIAYNSQALQNQSAALAVTGNNLANVNSDTYVRQRLTNSTTAAEGSANLERYTVEQIRDAVLDASIVAENGELGELEAESKILDQLNTLFSESLQENLSTTLEYSTDSDSSGITATFDAFYSAWSDLASDPTSETAKEVVYQTAQTVVDSLNALSSELDDLESTVNDYIDESVEDINDLTVKIADLNDQIVRAELGNSSTAADLRNQRQALLEELGGLVNVDYSEEENGSVTVTNGDNSLVKGSVSNDVFRGDDGVLGFDYIDDQGASTHVDLSITIGSLAGYIDSLSSISNARSELNSMVSSFVTAVNEAYSEEVAVLDENDVPVLDEDTGEVVMETVYPGFFSVTETTVDEVTVYTGLTAASISLDSSIASGSDILADYNEASGNDMASAVAALGESDSTFQESFITLSTSIASQYAEAEDQLESQELINEMLEEQRSSISGVNLNEEVTNMMVQQRAFQASSRVINILDQLLSTVVNELV